MSMAPRILVVDDSAAIREVFRMVLTDEGYEVTLCSGPDEAVAEIEQSKPDLIILDWIFGMEYLGMPMIEWLKEEPATADIPVLVCSAAPDHIQEVEAFLKSKGVGIVYKPFELDGLLSAVASALGSAG